MWREQNTEVIMRRHFGRKIVCLFVVSSMVLANFAGCSKGENIPHDELGNEISGEMISSSIYNSDDGDVENGKSETGDDSKAEQVTSEKITSEKTPSEEETTLDNDETSLDESQDNSVTDTSNEKTTTKDSETTKPIETTKQQQTTAKQTSKPNKTTQKTIAKPKPQEQTTAKPQVSKAEQMAKAIVNDIITSKMSEFEKALTIHDWLIFNLDYDFTYSNYYVEEALTDRRCVCQGYALTFKMMCEMAGLKVNYVTGKGYSGGQWGGHAWNQVRIDGKWYNVDVTWDDPASPGKEFSNHSGNRHDYFLISDARINKDHNATSSGSQTCSNDYDRVAIVKASTNNEYHSSFGFATNAEEMALAINKLVEANKTEIYIKYYEPNLTADNMWNGIYDKLKLAKYPIIGGLSAYTPVDGIATYVLNVMPLSEWNKITVITSEEQLNTLMDTTYNSGKKTLTVRYEPVDGNVWFYSEKYIFTQKDRSEYNGGKAIYTTIEINGLQEY